MSKTDLLDIALRIGHGIDEIPDLGSSPEETFALNEALSKLTKLQLEVIGARMAEIPFRQIAREIGFSLSRTHNIYTEAVHFLRKELMP